MAVSSPVCALRYTGNGSDETAYAITFAFLNTSHIFAAIYTDGIGDPELLDPSDYTVTRDEDGQGGSLVTAEAVSVDDEIVIFRQVPLTQPQTFQPAGPFPARANEKGFDRLAMQIQQINRRVNELEGVTDEDYIFIPGNDPSAFRGVQIFADATARGLAAPLIAGQLGVQVDTQTVWIGQSTDTGDWEEFRARRTGRLVLGLVADAGEPGAEQTAVADLLDLWQPDAVLFAGDNNYNGAAGYTADWAAFASYIAAGTAYPALGNHDVDEEDWEDRHDAKFPYLPGNRRYYNVTLGDGLVELFVLHSGLDSLGELVEPDLNTVGGDQHQWFVEQLNASTARWKIAMFHHPPVSLNNAEGRVVNEMAWPEFERMDMICCGHTHMLELLKWSDTMLVNLSASVYQNGDASASLTTEAEITDYALWADDESLGMGRIVATEERLTVEVYHPNGSLLHAREAGEFTPPAVITEVYRSGAISGDVGDITDEYCGTLPAASMIRGVRVSINENGTTDIYYEVKVNGVAVADGVLVSGTYLTDAVPVYADLPVFPAGSRITITTDASYGPHDATRPLDVALYLQRHK